MDDEDIQSIFRDTLENLPHLSVEVVETLDHKAVSDQPLIGCVLRSGESRKHAIKIILQICDHA